MLQTSCKVAPVTKVAHIFWWHHDNPKQSTSAREHWCDVSCDIAYWLPTCVIFQRLCTAKEYTLLSVPAPAYETRTPKRTSRNRSVSTSVAFWLASSPRAAKTWPSLLRKLTKFFTTQWWTAQRIPNCLWYLKILRPIQTTL